MEYFCNEVKDKICVNFENREIQDITKAVDILMNRFVDELQTKYPDVKIEKLLLCGSMAEKTRVWGSDESDLEFDYLAVMKSWPGCEDFVFDRTLDGQMEIKHKVAVDQQSGQCEYVKLNPKAKATFSKILGKCLNAKCEQNLCALRNEDIQNCFSPDSKGCQFCSVHMKTGTLKCVKFMINVLGHSSRLEKFRFVWTRRCKSLPIPCLREIVSQYSFEIANKIFGGYAHAHSYDLCFPEPVNFKYNSLDITVGADFNPVIKLDLNKVSRNLEKIQSTDNTQVYILLPNYYLPANRLTLKYQTALLKKQNLTCYILKLLLNTKRLIIQQTAQLLKNERYLLFPKHHYTASLSWRISTCQTELDILNGTTEEHRTAYCVLKFMIAVLKAVNSSRDSFPHIGHYEAKIAVIRHIKSCTTPRIGVHVCLLNIMHDIALCRDSGSMDHPILHLNLYEMQASNTDVLRNSYKLNVTFFKVLILLLTYQRFEYNLTDLKNDIFSVEALWCYTMYSTSYQQNISFNSQLVEEVYTTKLLTELKTLVQNRKKISSRLVVSRVIISIIRKARLRNFQYSKIQNNLDVLGL